MTPQEQAFADWRTKADQSDLLKTALKYGTPLKRNGQEWVGACAHCGGKDKFCVSPTKQKWICRGNDGGRGPIGMLMHLQGLSFLEACAELTGEPCPNGHVKPLSPEQQAERSRIREQNEVRRRYMEALEQSRQEDTREAAQRIWGVSKPVEGTLAESYLRHRGLAFGNDGFPQVLRFHPELPYPGKGKLPALVCRVDDVAGNLTAVWRIFLASNGRKAAVDNPKLGLGPAGGGAVRLGGEGRKIGLAEGCESALGAWNLIGRKYPIWSTLSTSGLTGIELPLGVEHVVIFMDGDHSMRKKDGEYVPAVPAGRKAALSLRTRLLAEGVACTLAAEPAAGRDYADVWSALAEEMA